MGACVFDKCCGCIELKTGCFIIGYFSLVIYLILAVISIFAMAVGGVVMNQNETDDVDNKQTGLAVLIVGGIFLLIIAFLLTFIIVLLVGLHKNKPGHVKAYLVYAVIFFILSIIRFIVAVSSGGIKGADIAENIFNLLLTAYFILVVRSQYLVMKNPQRGPAIYNSA